MKRNPFKVRFEGRRFTIIPDAFLDFRYRHEEGRQRRLVVLLEHDRATEEQQTLSATHSLGYISLLKSEEFQEAIQCPYRYRRVYHVCRIKAPSADAAMDD